jgi:hypothetical protein
MDVLGPGGILFLAKGDPAGQLLAVIRPLQLQLRKEVGHVPFLIGTMSSCSMPAMQLARWTSNERCLRDKQMGMERDKLNFSESYPLLMMLASNCSSIYLKK